MSPADEQDPTGIGPDRDEAEPGWPWSFILLVVAGALYLIFRFIDLAVKVLS